MKHTLGFLFINSLNIVAAGEDCFLYPFTSDKRIDKTTNLVYVTFSHLHVCNTHKTRDIFIEVTSCSQYFIVTGHLHS